MEGKTLCMEIKDDMFYINDPLRYKKFKCELELLYKEYYIGDISFGVFKQLVELFAYTSRPLLDKEVHFAIEYIDDEYHLEFIYPGIINIEINIMIPSNNFTQDKNALHNAIKNISGAQAIIEYVDFALSKLDSKENEFIITDNDMKTFETIGLEKFKELISKHDMENQIKDIYGDKVENLWLRGLKYIFQANKRFIIKDDSLIHTFLESNPFSYLGIKDDDGYYSIYSSVKATMRDYTSKIINMGDHIKLKGAITFNRSMYKESSEISWLKLIPELIDTHEICKLPFRFKDVKSMSKFMKFNLIVYNGKTYNEKPYNMDNPIKIIPQRTNVCGLLEYKLFTKNNILFLKVIGFISNNHDYQQNAAGYWVIKRPHLCRINKYSKLGESFPSGNVDTAPYYTYTGEPLDDMNSFPEYPYIDIIGKWDIQNGLCTNYHIISFILEDIILK